MKRIFAIFALFLLLFVSPNFVNAQTNDVVVVLDTHLGKIVIEFFPGDAPKTVDNFLNLAESGFYDDVIFHRIIKGFMIQGGDPLSKNPESQSLWGTGDAGQNIKAEFNTIKHNRGIVSMARSTNPDSASSQFFIVHADSNFLDEQYTVFGRIITQESFDTLDKIASLETGSRDVPTNPEQAKILTAKVVQRSEISDLLEINEPERVESTPEPEPRTETQSEFEPYVNNRLGISFLAPTGWTVQELQKTSSDVPDIVFIGPKTGEIPPTISIGIISTGGKTLQQYIDERMATIQPVIDEGTLEILSNRVTVIDDREAWVIEAIGGTQSGSDIIIIKFAEVAIHTFEKVYIIIYSNTEEDFENYKVNYENIINSFLIQGDSTPSLNIASENETSQEGGGCLIATATFGSELSPQVQQLRELRDNIVLNTKSGTAFMTGFNQFYYSFSPTIADWERENPVFKELVKVAITPLLATLSILNHVDIDYDEEMLGYGIGIIMMNVGMYFVAPAMIVYRFRK